MKTYYFIIAFVLLFVYGCGNKTVETKKDNSSTESVTKNENVTKNETVTNTISEEDKVALAKTLDEISAIFKKKDAKKLKEYYYFDNQFLFVSNPGVYTVASLEENLLSEIFDNLQFTNKDLKYEAWAECDIDTQNWTKTGNFAEPNNQTDYFGSICQNMIDYELGADATLVNKAKEIDKMTMIKVLYTEQYLRFYFAKKNGKWLIVAIDIHDFSA